MIDIALLKELVKHFEMEFFLGGGGPPDSTKGLLLAL